MMSWAFQPTHTKAAQRPAPDSGLTAFSVFESSRQALQPPCHLAGHLCLFQRIILVAGCRGRHSAQAAAAAHWLPAAQGELVVANVFVRVFIAQPAFQLSDPAGFTKGLVSWIHANAALAFAAAGMPHTAAFLCAFRSG